eukprot:c17372_g1_i1 orf=1-315(-)
MDVCVDYGCPRFGCNPNAQILAATILQTCFMSSQLLTYGDTNFQLFRSLTVICISICLVSLSMPMPNNVFENVPKKPSFAASVFPRSLQRLNTHANLQILTNGRY